MENRENIVAAIDVGTTKIVALIGKKDEKGNIEILGYGRNESKGIRRGAVLNVEEATRSIKRAVDEAEAKSGIKITEAYIGIAGQNIRSEHHEHTLNRASGSEPITAEEVDNLLKQMRNVPTPADEKVLHILPQSYSVDNEHEIEKPEGICGKQLTGKFHIVFGKEAAINTLRNCIENNNIKVLDIILEPLASATSVLSENDKELGVALVDIGGGTTDLAIYINKQIFHTNILPFGGNAVTNDIKEGCKILSSTAESLKVQYGAATYDQTLENKVVNIPGADGLPAREISLTNLSKIIEARMAEIINHINAIIEQVGASKQLNAGIVFTGGGSMLRSLTQLASRITAQDIRIGGPNKHIKSNKDITALPSNATAIGLLMMGLDKNLISNNNIVITNKAEEKNDAAVEQKSTAKANESKESFLERFGSSITKRIIDFVTDIDPNDKDNI